jgi:transposase
MGPVGNAIELQERRKQAECRMRAGERPVDVARSLGVSTTAVHNWKRAATHNGLRSLNAIPQHVPQCRLSSE